MMAIYPLLSEIPILSTLPRRGGTIKLNSIYSEGPLARLLYSHYSSITIINDIGNIMSSIHSFYLYDILQFTINWNLNRPHLACSSWYKPLNSNCWEDLQSPGGSYVSSVLPRHGHSTLCLGNFCLNNPTGHQFARHAKIWVIIQDCQNILETK